MKIQAAIATSPDQPFRIESCELAEPQAGEILVKVHACGICHTDVGAKLQHMPVALPKVLGHEGAGVVERVGPGVTNFAPGDHVLMTFGSCGACEHCFEGHPSYCEDFRPINLAGRRAAGPSIRLGGEPVGGSFFAQSAFATHALSTGRNTLKIDKDLPLAMLAPLGCGILTGMGSVLNCLRPTAGSSIVVFGTGSVGLAAIMAAKIAGCTTIVAVDVKDSRLEVAKAIGATHAVNGKAADLLDQLMVITRGGAHHSVDTTGVPMVVANSMACLRKRGSTAQVAVSSSKDGYKLDPGIVVGRGIQVMGVIEGDTVPWSFIPKMIGFYRKGMLPLEKLVRTYPFEEINEAVKAMEEGDAVKPVLLMT
jgi:aryl-alcohol dehydrogenase